MEALSPAAERDAFAAVWALIQSRPQASVYVYSPYEKTQCHRLAARYPDVCAVSDTLHRSPAQDLDSDACRPQLACSPHPGEPRCSES